MSIITDLTDFSTLGYKMSVEPSVYTPDIVFRIDKFGLNLDIDSVKADVWSNGGVRNDPTTAERLSIVSGSSADASGGTGAWSVRLFGVDINCNLIDEYVTLNGLTPVLTVNKYYRMYRAYVVEAGSGGKNAAAITFTQETSSYVIGAIPWTTATAGFNQSQLSHFIIPAGYQGFLTKYTVKVGGLQGASGSRLGDIHLEQRAFNQVWRIKETYGLTSDCGPSQQDHSQHPEEFDPKTEIKFSCTAEVDNTRAYVHYELFCINLNYLG